MSSSYQYSSSNRNGTVPPPLPAPLMQANAGSKSNAHPSVTSSLSTSYDFLVKMVIVGDSGVGKSSLMRQFVDHQFPENYLSTIGVDFSIKRMDVEGRTAKVQIWDTAGQERFANIVSTYYRGTHGVMVVVDVTNPHSLASVPKWVEQARSYAPVGCVLTLVANKCDLTQHRCVSHSQLADMADNYGMTLVEVSAKAADNVEKAFATLVHAVADMLADNFRDAAAAKLKVDQVDTSGGSKLDDDRACCVTM